jgi:hypothetical protein
VTRPRTIWLAVFALLAVLVAVDRAAFAGVAQWREDQACNLWLGYTRGPLELPLGLMSSVGVPNPNGMPLVGALLSRLPNLWAVSTVLGCVQGLLLLWLAWLLTGPSRLFPLVALPAVSSIILRASSLEFWNQWIFSSWNAAFFGCLVWYVRRRSLFILVLIAALALYAPALYLAGLLNAVLYALFIAAAALLRPPQLPNWKHAIAPALLCAGLCCASAVVTWAPYARVMVDQSAAVSTLTKRSAATRVRRAANAAVQFPSWMLMHWYAHHDESFLQSGDTISTPASRWLVRASKRLLLAQAIVFMLALLLAAANWLFTGRRKPFFAPGRAQQGSLGLSAVAFVMLALMLCPLLGGPTWAQGRRADQQVQFLPMLLVAWFLVPFTLDLPRLASVLVRGASVLVATGFTLASLPAGWLTIEAHLDYRGAALNDADVPLAHQTQAIDFIARDWKAISRSRRVPVAYEIGQHWIDGFGRQLEPWYPAPMTVGRAYDYQLLRIHGLKNRQEGTQVRSPRRARYIVSYAWEPPPERARSGATHHEFGRLRVSVRDRR